ncbi:hypothetical protein ACWGJX_14440 [Streptomyces sp. NPDC054775]
MGEEVPPFVDGVGGAVRPAVRMVHDTVRPVAHGVAGSAANLVHGVADEVPPFAGGVAGAAGPLARGVAGQVPPFAGGLAGNVRVSGAVLGEHAVTGVRGVAEAFVPQHPQPEHGETYSV